MSPVAVPGRRSRVAHSGLVGSPKIPKGTNGKAAEKRDGSDPVTIVCSLFFVVLPTATNMHLSAIQDPGMHRDGGYLNVEPEQWIRQ